MASSPFNLQPQQGGDHGPAADAYVAANQPPPKDPAVTKAGESAAELAERLQKLRQQWELTALVAGQMNPILGKLVVGVGATTEALAAARSGAASFAAVATPAGLALSAFAAGAGEAWGALKSLASAASPNGLKALDQSWELLAGTVGTLVLPGFVLLAAGVMTAADLLMVELAPALDDVAAFYAGHIDDFVSFAKTIVDATKAVIDFIGGLKNDPAKTLGDSAKSFLAPPENGVIMDTVRGIRDQFGVRDQSQLPGDQKSGGWWGKVQDPLGTKPPPGIEAWDHADDDTRPKPKARDVFMGNLMSIIKDMENSMGAKTEFHKGEDVWKKAVIAASGGDIEAKRLAMFTLAMDYLRKMADNTATIAQNPGVV